MKRTHIVAAIICNHDKTKIYITKRPNHVHQGGLWEFPGGKVENNESIEDAMCRELEEEIGIMVTTQSHFEHFEFDYSDKALVFDFMLVTHFDHDPYGREGQQGQWVDISDIHNYRFPNANISIVNRVTEEFT